MSSHQSVKHSRYLSILSINFATNRVRTLTLSCSPFGCVQKITDFQTYIVDNKGLISGTRYARWFFNLSQLYRNYFFIVMK